MHRYMELSRSTIVRLGSLSIDQAGSALEKLLTVPGSPGGG